MVHLQMICIIALACTTRYMINQSHGRGAPATGNIRLQGTSTGMWERERRATVLMQRGLY